MIFCNNQFAYRDVIMMEKKKNAMNVIGAAVISSFVFSALFVSYGYCTLILVCKFAYYILSRFLLEIVVRMKNSVVYMEIKLS